MKKILVGVDGSEAARAALDWAGRLGKSVGADVVAATVFRADGSETDPERYESLRDEAGKRLRDEWALPADASVPYSSLLLADTPRSLLDAAEREHADLVVVGPQADGRFASLHIGSFAHHLAHYTDRPLAIVPEAGAHRGLERIVLGLDGSDGSADAARWCAAIAEAVGAHVVATYAFKPPMEFLPESDPHSWFVTVQNELDRWVGPLRESNVSFEAHIAKETHPVAGMVRTIDTTDADLVVVGARGVGGFSGLRVGRVPLQLVHHTHVPVIMVPETGAQREA